MVDEEQKPHSATDIWNRVNQQGDQISELAKAQAATDAQLLQLARMVESGFSSVTDEIRHWRDRDTRPTNWIGIGSLVFSLMVVTSGFVVLITAPIVDGQSNIRSEVQALQRDAVEAAYQRGVNSATDEHYKTWLEYIEDQTDAQREDMSEVWRAIGKIEGQ